MRVYAKLLYSLLALLLLSCGGSGGLDLPSPTAVNISISATSINPPTNTTYGLGANIDFQVTFPDTVTVTSGVPCLDLTIGSNSRSACYTSGSGSNTLNFSYTTQASDLDSDGIELEKLIILNSSSIKDSSSIDVDLSVLAVTPNLSAVLVDTVSITPPDQVVVFNQTNLSEDRTQATFNWSAPANNGTPITSYLLKYKKSSDTTYTFVSPNPTVTSATITGLDTEELYDVQVAAFNGVAGAYSSVLSFSTIFSPASLGALVWYEAKDINGTGVVPADGDSITTMVDKSGNGNNATVITGTPAQISTTDSKKVLTLGSVGYRTAQSLGEVANTDVEVYIVAKTRVISQSFAFVNVNEGNSNRFGTHFPWSNGNAYVDLPIGNRVNGAWGGNTTDFFAWTFRGSTTQGIALERDGVEILTGANRTLTPPLKTWTIGSRYDGTSKYWQADFVAMFVFDKVLTTSQRADFFKYIEDEYGVTMTY